MEGTTVTALVPISDIQQMAVAVAKSGLFGVKTPDQAMALMLIAQAEGLHPAIAARDYHIIQGRPALKADAMLARFQQAGGKVEWKVYTDDEVTGVFSHAAGGSLSVSWTIAQALKIGLASKDNWKNFPRAMLRSRCISEGIRSVYPGCVVGTYTDEETEAFSAPSKTSKNIPIVEEVEEIVVSSDEEEGLPAVLTKPDGEIYGRYKDEQEWSEAYASLVGRLAKAKLPDDQKRDKQQALWAVNQKFIETMSTNARLQLRSLILGEGGTLEFPKNQPPVGTELSGSES